MKDIEGAQTCFDEFARTCSHCCGHILERPCVSQEGGSMLLSFKKRGRVLKKRGRVLKKRGRFLRRGGGFLRRGGGFLRRGV